MCPINYKEFIKNVVSVIAVGSYYYVCTKTTDLGQGSITMNTLRLPVFPICYSISPMFYSTWENVTVIQQKHA